LQQSPRSDTVRADAALDPAQHLSLGEDRVGDDHEHHLKGDQDRDGVNNKWECGFY
jgi:hypothetical protein